MKKPIQASAEVLPFSIVMKLMNATDSDLAKMSAGDEKEYLRLWELRKGIANEISNWR